MQLKILINYIKYSGIWAGVAINPFHWQFKLEFLQPDELNPDMTGFYISVGPVWVRLIIDNGSW